MYLFECEATFEAEPAEVWKVWTDVERSLAALERQLSS